MQAPKKSQICSWPRGIWQLPLWHEEPDLQKGWLKSSPYSPRGFSFFIQKENAASDHQSVSRPDSLISMGSISVEEGKADKIFGWTDGVVFHFSVTVLVEMAKGFCSEQEIFLTASFLSRSAGTSQYHDKTSPEHNPSVQPFVASQTRQSFHAFNYPHRISSRGTSPVSLHC